ncbi:MAG: MBL fold metallo-hydrolase [Burkholderiales bacterium]|nr:MBL fold metallo-hydrolase [Burkholderiales bacterium]
MALMRKIRWLCCVLCLWSAAQPACAGAPDCTAAASVDWQAVAPGVWVWLPEHLDEISPHNRGQVLPISAVVDAGEALVVDPGPSHQHGLRVRRSLACQLGARVRWVVNTHAHAESVLGNSAFADLQALGQLDIVATAGTREAMQRRCAQCLSYLTSIAGAEAMQDTRIVLPNRIMSEGETLAVGRIRLQVMQVGNAHTESDLLLWEPQRRIMWAGGLLYEGRIPELAQGSLNGWLHALPRLKALRPVLVVGAALSVAPDAGSLPSAFGATDHYLQALRMSILQAMDAGLDGSDIRSIQLPDFAGWAGYRQRHGFNVQRAWRELEPEWLDATGPASPRLIPDVGR